MTRNEFVKFIQSIGFKYNGLSYRYKNYDMYLHVELYKIYNHSGCIGGFEYNELGPIKYYFKKELRSIKLKQLLR